MALLHVLPEAQGARTRHRRAPGDTLEGRRLHRQAPPPPRGARGRRQAGLQGQRRRGARARLLGLGDRVQVRGDHSLTPRRQPAPAGRARASTHRRRETKKRADASTLFRYRPKASTAINFNLADIPCLSTGSATSRNYLHF